MDRRAFITIAGGIILAAPLGGEAQEARKVWRIGVLLTLYSSADADPLKAFRQRLRELGYVEGQNIAIDWRYAHGRDDHLPGLAAELVQRKVDLIVADITHTFSFCVVLRLDCV